MMKTRRKLLSILLALVMTLSLIPTTALAAEEDGTPGSEVSTEEQNPAPQAETSITTAVELLAAVEAGGTATPGADLEVTLPNSITKNFTLDLGGKTLTLRNTKATIVSDGATLTINNGKINAPDVPYGTVAVFSVLENSAIALDHIDMDTTGSALYPQGNAASVTVTDSTINAGVYAVGTNASNGGANGGVVIKLTGSTFTCTHGYQNGDGDNCPVMINVPGTLTVDDCTITGNRQAVLVRGGDATIKNSTIKLDTPYAGTDANAYDDKAWGQGNNLPMAALVVGNNASAYQYPANCALENTAVTAPSDYRTVYAYGMDEAGREVTLVYDEASTVGTVDTKGAAKVGTPVAEIDGKQYLTLADAVEAAKDGETVTLLKTTETSNRITINKNLTLDLGGHTLTSTVSFAIVVAPEKKFTLQNGTLTTTTGTGVAGLKGSTITIAKDAVLEAGLDGIMATNNSADEGQATVNVYGTLNTKRIGILGQGPNNTYNIVGANITSNYFGVYQNGSFGGAKVEIQDSTITNEGGSAVYISNSNTNATDSNQGMQTLHIKDSSITGPTAVEVKYTNVTIEGEKTILKATAAPPSETLNNNGSVTTGYAFAVTHNGTKKDDGSVTTTDSSAGEVVITAGTFEGLVGVQSPIGEKENAAKVAISAGSFSSKVEDEYCAPGFTPSEADANGKYTVTVGESKVLLTKADGSKAAYDTLADAIAAAGADDTVKLLDNVKEDVVIPAGANITLDLNGKTLTNVSDHTITNNGTLTIKDSVGSGVVFNQTSGKSALQNEPGGTVTINGGTLKKDLNIDSNDYYVITNHGKLITINAGTITSASTHSSAIENGWFTPSQNTSGEISEMIINGGEVSNTGVTASGGLYTLKNDDYGKMTINGGTFTNTAANAGAVLNWNELTIAGGVFTANNASVATMCEGTTGSPTNNYEQGKTTITGGTFNGFLGSNTGYNAAIDVNVSAGSFSTVVPEEYCADGFVPVTTKDDNGMYTVTKEAEGGNPTVTGLELDATSLNLQEGSSKTVTATVTTNPAGGAADITWTSDKPQVATVDANGKVTAVGAGTATITVKAGNLEKTFTVTVSARPSSGGSDSSDDDSGYSVSVDSGKHGSVTVSPRTADKGETVTVTVKPDKGYELENLTVTTKNGKTVKLTQEKSNKFTFKMPDGKVTVEATFTKIDEAPRFTDVPNGYWAEDAIEWAADNGYMNGNTASTFNPEGKVTRQQLWMILARISGQQPADFGEARAWAVANGISDGTFPGNAVTRQQLVTILYRYTAAQGYPTTGAADLTVFPDHASVADYAKDAMSWSVDNGIVGGTAQGTLNPTGTATRAQFATILSRFYENVL